MLVSKAPKLPERPYQSHRGLALASIVCIGAVVPSALIIALWQLARHWLGPEHARLADTLTAVAICVSGLLSLTGVVTFLYWLRGAYRNLPSLGSTNQEIFPGLRATGREAVRSFLIPPRNLFRARRVMVHLWRESQPAPAVLPDGTVLLPKTSLVNWWYASWIASYFGDFSSRGDTTLFWPIVSWLLTILAASLCCVMVWTIEKRQAEQFRDIQLRQPAAPVTDQLR